MIFTINIRTDCGVDPNTQILISTGGIKLAKDVKAGDYLIGDDSTCRKVLSTYSWEDNMYQIVPNKGDTIICSESFRLTLKGIIPHLYIRKNRASCYTIRYSERGNNKSRAFKLEKDALLFKMTLPKDDTFDISICEYLSANKTFKEKTYIFHTGVYFTNQNVPFDPYIIGYWLGDGTSSTTEITTADKEIIKYFNYTLPEYGLEIKSKITPYVFNITGADDNYRKKSGNLMRNTLRNLNMSTINIYLTYIR